MKRYMKIIGAALMTIMCFVVPAMAAGGDAVVADGSISLSNVESDPDVTVSNAMSFSEMVERYAENAGITYQEALDEFPNVAAPCATSTYDIYYRVFSITLNVDTSYKPHLEIFCQTSEGGHFRNIDSIYDVQLVRSYGGTSKQFDGKVNVWLRNHNKIEYVVNGDFYNNGTTSITAGLGGTINVGESGSVTFSVTGGFTGSHYKYFYKHDTVTYGG